MKYLPIIFLSTLFAGLAPAQERAFTGLTILDGKGKVIKNATIQFSGNTGKITGIATGTPDPKLKAVPAGDLYLTPALINAGTVMGLNSANLNEESQEVTPDVSVLDGLDLFDPQFKLALSTGVGTVAILPGTKNVIGGTSPVLRFTGKDGRPQVAIKHQSLVATMGNDPSASNRRRPNSTPYFRRPWTRMGVVWAFRQTFFKARELPTDKLTSGAKLLKLALAGKLPLRITARPEHDINTALRLAREFKLKLSAIDGGQEAYRQAAKLKQANVPIVFSPSSNPRNVDTIQNIKWDYINRLAKAGVPLAIQTGRGLTSLSLIDEARVAVRLGLPRATALKAVTSVPARILGLADRIGTVALGKDADLVLWHGDPLSPTSRVVGVFIKGRQIYSKLPQSKRGSL